MRCQVESRVDEPDVRERLREVAEEVSRHGVVLFREKAHVISQREEPVKQSTGLRLTSHEGVVVR